MDVDDGAAARVDLRPVWKLLSWLLVVLIGGVLAACVLVPRVAGASTYSILTSSMEPRMPPGTLVVVRPTDADTISTGDVITYQLESGHDTVVTHRVVEQGVDADHEPVFRTQGDANPTPDQRWVKPAQIRGVRWYSVPWVGHVSVLLDGRQHQVLNVGLGLLLLGYAAKVVVAGRRSRRADIVETGQDRVHAGG